ncbi:MAG: PAS domain S-box protein [Pseudomonadota bacterium]
MDRKEPPSFDSLNDERAFPDHQLRRDAGTETIDLKGLFAEDVTASGSFDIRDDIWATTFGKVLQALPIPALLIEQSHNIVVANQAWGKIAAGYEKILGNPFPRLFAKDSVALEGESLVKKVFSTRRTATWEALLEIDKNRVWGRFTFRSIRIKDQRFLLVLVEDLSLEKKQLLLDRKYKEEFKKRVEDRTEELRKKNEELVREIADRRRSESALRESEQRFRSVFENHHAVMLIIDPETGKIEDACPGACVFYGYSREELKDKKIYEINMLSPEELLVRMEMAKSQQHRYFDFQHRLAGGEVREVEVCSGPIVAAGRTLLFSVINDVTDRKLAEEQLQESEKRYRTLFESAGDCIYILDAEGKRPGQIVSANPAAARMHGYTVEEMLSLNIADLDTPESARNVLGRLERVLKGEEIKEETTHRRKDGSEFPIEINPRLLALGGHKYVLAIDRDITDRKEMDASLKEIQRQQRALLDNIPDIAWLKDEESRFIAVNKAFGKACGVAPEDLRGKTDLDIWPLELAEHYRADDRDVMTSGNQKRVEEPLTDQDGNTTWIETIKTPIYNDVGENIGTTGIARDITERKRAEEALRVSEEQYRRLFEDAPLIYVITRNEQDTPFISDCNESFLSSLGYTREEVLGKPLADFYSPESIAELLDRGGYARALAGEFFMGERELVTRDGGVLPTLLYTATDVDPSGQVIGTRAMFVDITEQKRAREALYLRNRAIESSISGISIVDLDGSLTYVNPAALRLWRYDHEEEILGKRALGFWVTETEAEEAVEIAAKTGSWIGELMAKRKDGSPLSLQAAITLVRDPDGAPIAVMGSFLDISERKQAQEEIRQSEQRYRTLFEESIDGVYSVLRDGTIMDANASFCKLFGYTREETIGKDIRELYFDPADRPRFQEEIERKGSLKDHEVRFRKRDGTEIDCLLTSSVHFGPDGSIAGYRAILRDLTLRKGLQRQLLQAQKMEAIGTLAGGIAHDFNNILQVAVGYSELLLGEAGLPEEWKSDIQKINESASRGADLVKRLLTFGRKADTKPQPLNLNRCITGLRAMLERTIPKMIDIQLLLGENPARIHADPTQVDQLLMNLAVNARDAMPEGGKLIFETADVHLDEEYVRTHVEAKAGDYVLLMVTDTGSGMDQETLEHIFEPFYTTKAVGEGTGLGLAMVHGIVKHHGGHIVCYSEPGHGTTFKVYFPAEMSSRESEPTLEPSVTKGGSETILVVDDEELIRNLGSKILTKAGYSVITAANGKEALEVYQARSSEIALVILDLIMPEMGGKQCLELLLSRNPSVRVAIASGYSANGPTKEALAAGAKGFIHKPYNIREMLATVREVLDTQ